MQVRSHLKWKDFTKKLKKEKKLSFLKDATRNTQISSNNVNASVSYNRKQFLSCLFNPTMYNTAVMCLLLLTASIKTSSSKHRNRCTV